MTTSRVSELVSSRRQLRGRPPTRGGSIPPLTTEILSMWYLTMLVLGLAVGRFMRRRVRDSRLGGLSPMPARRRLPSKEDPCLLTDGVLERVSDPHTGEIISLRVVASRGTATDAQLLEDREARLYPQVPRVRLSPLEMRIPGPGTPRRG